MCQRVYIASRKELRTRRLSKKSPYLRVIKAEEDDPARGHFSGDLPLHYVAGAHLVCGCGFPAEYDDGKPSKVDANDLQSMRTLAECIREACREDSWVEMFLCWVNDDDEPPVGRRNVAWEELLDPAFRLRHRELLTVGRMAKERAGKA